MDNNETPQISSHALERFKERWKILRGKPLKEENVLAKLQQLIINAKPESESPALLKRDKRYGGKHRYMIKGPWRLVWKGNQLVTVELRHQGFFKPRLYYKEIRAKFYLRVTEKKDVTLIEKDVFRGFSYAEVLLLAGKPEVNAVIRFLRATGIDVAYKRTGTEAQKQAVLRVLLPKNFRQLEIEKTEGKVVWLKSPHLKESFYIFGIKGEDCQQIFDFINNETWIQGIQAKKEYILEEQKRRGGEHKKRRQEQKRKRRGKLEKNKKEKGGLEKKKPSLAEILKASHDPMIVWYKLKKAYRNQIQMEECKLGKTWIIRYRFLTEEIDISSVVKDVRFLNTGRVEAVSQLISQLRNSLELSKPAV